MSFWEKLGISYQRHTLPMIGDIGFLTHSISDFSQMMYDAFPSEKFYGTFRLWRPHLVVKDPELIEQILIKDFSYFYNRNFSGDADANILSRHLVNFEDEKWKTLRNKLTPTFSSGKLKGMQPQLIEKAQSLVKYLNRFNVKDQIEIKDLCGRFTMDVIASCSFGLDLDIMNNPDSQFYQIGKQTFAANYFAKCFFLLQPFLAPFYKKTGINIIPKKLSNFFVNAIDETLKYRKNNHVVKQDFLHHLTELMAKDEELVKKNELDPNDLVVFNHCALVSNSFIFFAAGYETTATTLAHLFYEFALNQDVQDKAYNEISNVVEKYHGEFTFQAIDEMDYLDNALSETLRIHPPGVALDRKCTKEYQIPGTDVILPVGTAVIIPTYGIHLDPQYFPEPLKFDPDRFDPEKNTIIKGTYLPFGAGPRICIATRFAKLEAKVCASMVLKNFKILPCSKTMVPIEYDSRTFMLSPVGGVHVSLEKR